ncbi:hypothetical protein [Paenibacillus sp. NFR01]|uniref:hypothetical protein n=1 Tax=Paenibacillus sp. NFR01 TaxID=1566279 RepID=UPI0008CBD664|nr:hypothetical protein [Paenibacillus sp. NFR01]SET62117.1 hypothetical protein SAMN03159358_2209 [Paenibacillus sp. NFR01]
MANIMPKVFVELDPRQPVPEILAVISAMMPYNPDHEVNILLGVADAVQKRLELITKGSEANGIPAPERKREDQ